MARKLQAVIVAVACLAAGCHGIGHSGDEPSRRSDERAQSRSPDGGSAKPRASAITDKGKEIERSLGVD